MILGKKMQSFVKMLKWASWGPWGSHFYWHDTMIGKRKLLHTFCMWNILSFKEFQLISLARRTSLCIREALVTQLCSVQTFSYILNFFLHWCSYLGELEIAGAVNPIPQMKKHLGLVHKRQDLAWSQSNRTPLPVASCKQARDKSSLVLGSPETSKKCTLQRFLQWAFRGAPWRAVETLHSMY